MERGKKDYTFPKSHHWIKAALDTAVFHLQLINTTSSELLLMFFFLFSGRSLEKSMHY